jgi:phage-related protein (TIGR01555 family)
MSKRHVRTAAAALASTRKPVRPEVIAGDTAVRLRASDGLENVVAGLGTDRDKRTFSNYNTPRVLTRFELENMYRCSWLAKRIVNTVADDMTREWRRFTFGDADDNPQLEALEKAEKQYAVKAKINHSLRWSRLYGGCLVIIGINGQDDLSQPLDVRSLGKGSLKYLHVVDRWRVAPNGVLNKELTSPNFGLPEAYLLAESSVQIHHTRVLRFNGEKLPYFAWLQNAMWDDSSLQHVYDSIQNYDATSAAIATMLFESNIDVINSPGLTEVLSTKNGEAKLTRRFQLAMLMKSFNRTLLLDEDEKYEKKQNQFSNLDKIWEQFMVDTSGAAEIPIVKLFGQSASGLNSTGDNDIRNYYDKCSAQQESDLRPQLEYLDEILVRSTLGTMPPDYKFEFNSLWQMDDKEQAEIEYNRAQRDQIYLQSGVVTEGLVASELKAQGTYRSMSQEDVELAIELSEAADPTPGKEDEPVVPGKGNQVAGVAQPAKTEGEE